MTTQKKDTLDIALDYAIAFEIQEPKHFDMIPEILDYLTYIETEINKKGEKVYVRKRLTPIEKELYRVIRRTAGSGACWKNRDDLAFEVNCSAGSITNAKKALSQSFEQLDGKSLITIEKRMMPTYRDNVLINKKPNDLITITHIWNYNNAFKKIFPNIDYREKYKTGILTDKEAELAIESLRQPAIVHNSGGQSIDDRPHKARSNGDKDTQRTPSPGDINHIHKNHIPYDKSYPRTDVRNHDFEKNDEIHEFMKSLGIFPKEQTRLLAEYTKKHIAYTIYRFNKLKDTLRINTPGAYFVSMLKTCY